MGMTQACANNKIPISIFPRWNFHGMNQLVNHIDKAVIMMGGAFKNKLIIRTGIISKATESQCQHIGDFTEAIRLMQ